MGLGQIAFRALLQSSTRVTPTRPHHFLLPRALLSTSELCNAEAAAAAPQPEPGLQKKKPVGDARVHFLSSLPDAASSSIWIDRGGPEVMRVVPLLNENRSIATRTVSTTFSRSYVVISALSSRGLSSSLSQSAASVFKLPARNVTTESASQGVSASPGVPQHIKFKRLDKTARHIMQIIDKESVEEVKTSREIPEIKPGYIVQLKVEVPENKRRVSIIKGIVIARRNAGLNSTFRIRRLVAGVGIENLFHLYSPNIKEIQVLDKKKVRRAKLYYLRDKMNALKKQ